MAYKPFKMKVARKNTSLDLGMSLDILGTMSTNKWAQGVAAKECGKQLGVKISPANISWWISMLSDIEKLTITHQNETALGKFGIASLP
jgi:hypothetical protein